MNWTSICLMSGLALILLKAVVPVFQPVPWLVIACVTFFPGIAIFVCTVVGVSILVFAGVVVFYGGLAAQAGKRIFST